MVNKVLTFPSELPIWPRNSRGNGCLLRASEGLRLREFAMAASAADSISPLLRLSDRIVRLPIVDASLGPIDRSRSDRAVTPFLGESGADVRRSRMLSERAGKAEADGGVKSSGDALLVGKFSRSVSDPDALDKEAERSRRKLCVDKREEVVEVVDAGAGERDSRANAGGEGVESREPDVMDASLLRT